MKKLLATIILKSLFVLGLSGAAWAADINLEWKQSLGADGYEIETSEDLGATWTQVPNLVYTTRIEGTLNLASAIITVADNVLVLVRVGAYNSVGLSWRLEAGVFFNSAWILLPAPTGLGAN